MSMHKKKHNEEVEENWLISYADMITLLICFFVIMLSIMEKKQTHKEDVEQAIKESFSSDPQVVEEKPFTTLLENMQQVIEQHQAEESVSMEETDNGIMMELSSSSFYEPGSATFKQEALPVLKDIANVLNEFNYEDYIVIVEGHTDDVPIQTPQFPSNWELSAMRATGVVRFFIGEGQEHTKMRAMGLADVQPKVPNLDEFGNPIPENREINRRITIRVERRDD